MQGRLYKNIQNRTYFKKYEAEKRLYKYLIHNKQVGIPESTVARVFKKQFSITNRASSSYIRNLCFLTTKARSTYRDFRLNRNMIKICASKKLLQGIKRAS